MTVLQWIKIGLAVAALAAIAGLGLWVKSLRVDLAAAQLLVAQREDTIRKANTQNHDLNLALVTANRELALSQLQGEAEDAALEHAQNTIDQLNQVLKDAKGRVNNAPPTDDGPAAPKLIYAAAGLQQFAQALNALRAGNDNQVAARGDAHPAVSAQTPWPRLTQGFTQGDFAGACFELGDALKDAAGQLSGIAKYQTDYNTNIRQFNAASGSGA